MGERFTFDLGTLIQLGTTLVVATFAFAASNARDDAQDSSIAAIERGLDRERDERLAAQARLRSDAVADRALLMGRVARQLRRSTPGAEHQ